MSKNKSSTVTFVWLICELEPDGFDTRLAVRHRCYSNDDAVKALATRKINFPGVKFVAVQALEAK